MSNVKWGRVVGAGIAALFVDDLFAMVPVFGWFIAPVLGWIAAVVVALLAFWVARTVAGDAAVRHGVLVGAVAGAGTLIIGLPGFALLSAVLMVIAGAVGGALGHARDGHAEGRAGEHAGATGAAIGVRRRE